MRIVALLLIAFPALGQEQDVQRALIERDQRTAEFAARLRGAPLIEQQRLENLSVRQLLLVEKALPPALRAYERQRAAQDHVLQLPPPAVRAPAPEAPRPLPARMPGVVDVIASPLQILTPDRSTR